MGERAQFTTPRWVPPLVIGTAVLVVVADAVLEAQREAMTQCAPDCQGGAPLFEIHAQPTFLDAALSNPWPFVHHATALAAIALLTWIGSYLFTFAKWPEADGDE